MEYTRVDMAGKTCIKCGKGTYREKFFHDDMDGVQRCNRCEHITSRYIDVPATKPKKAIDMFTEIFELSRSTLNTKPLFVRNSKIMEELGEFSEALMHKEGHLPHKTMKEPLAGEAADVIICVLDTFAAANPELSIQEVSALLQGHLKKKTLKWARVLHKVE